MTFLSRLAFLGAAKETTNGTPVVPPTFSIPFTKASYETIYAPLRDESVRGNDVILQGLYQGVADGTWDIETHFYPDICGYFLRHIGPDTVTAATVNTTQSGSSVIGATSIQSVATIPLGTVIQIDTGSNVEWAVTGTPSGAGPFTIPIAQPTTGLKFAHTTAAIVSQTTHTFAQSSVTRPPSFTLAVFDNVDYRTWAGALVTELAIKIDPKGTVTFNPKFITFPEATTTTFTPTFTTLQPFLGWEWTITNAGATSTRGLSMDFTMKRAGEAIHTGNGVQAPRETFVGALEVDGAYKAIYENVNDYNLFLNYTQTPTVHTLTKPGPLGGESLAITMSQSGYHKGTRDLGSTYVQAAYDVSAIGNTTDGGVTKVVLKNWTTTAY
ncbi:MAG TPA: phage tail tube protein [Candidatus Paceibacterota bacterium]